MDAVGADEDIARDARAVGQARADAVSRFVEALDARAEAKSCLAEAAEQHVEQVGPVRVVVGRPELRLGGRAERGEVEPLAGVPGAVVTCLRIDAHPREGLAEPEPAKDAGRVGTQLDPGADLGERPGLLEDERIDAALAQHEGGGDAADAAANDQDSQTFSPA